MDIANLCRREVVAVSANTSVRKAAQAMRNQHVGSAALRGGIVREGMRVRTGAQSNEQPGSFYLARHEP